MAHWRDQLRPASFAGVPFEVETVTRTTPKRVAEHALIGVDGTLTEDLGRGSPTWQVEGFVCGFYYMEKRDKLEKALDQRGPQTFTDPFRGTQNDVVVKTYAVSEGVTDGMGWARFSIEIQETISDPFLHIERVTSLTGSGRSGSFLVATNTLDAASAIVNSKYSEAVAALTKYPMAAATVVTSYVEEVQKIQEAIAGPLAGLVNSVGDLVDSIDDLEDEASALIQTPEIMLSRLEATWDQVTSLQVLNYFTSNHALTGLRPLKGTVIAQAVADAAWVVGSSCGRVALLRHGSLLLDEPYATADEALGAADRWLNIMQGEEETESDPVIYQALTDARTAVALAVESLASRLPEQIALTVLAPTSSLELAQRHYQDPARAEEIASRNPTNLHPGFIVGDISILSR